jgi:multicomponent Na+:H+ antiporter subunit C
MNPGEFVVYISLASFAIGFIGMVINPNMIKKIISLGIVETSVTLFYVGISALSGTVPPIITSIPFVEGQYADPVPQAVIITGIVIGFALLCLSLVFTIMLYNRYHTLDVRSLEEIFQRENEH